GTFDFDTPNFYTKFMRGKLLYFVTTDKPDDFLYIYSAEGRSVYEQVLNLNCNETKQLLQAVAYNMQEDNRFYKYDFLFDNCTTRIRDIVLKSNKNISVTENIVPPGTTFRDMIHYYLDRGSQPWSKLGMDILLGIKTDKPVTNSQAMFLPEYFMKGLNMADNKKPVVKQTIPLLPAQPKQEAKRIYTPLIGTGIICVVIFLISLSSANWAKTFTGIADALLFYITGLLGLLILFMWFGTDHIACSNNFNIAWALPTNFIAAFFLGKKPLWVKNYFTIAAIINAILLVAFFWLPQSLNVAVAPVILLMLNRYLNLSMQIRMRGQKFK
ncbi:MAG: DUF4105 domain-containing protein, partial [Parafilimonas sp.]